MTGRSHAAAALLVAALLVASGCSSSSGGSARSGASTASSAPGGADASSSSTTTPPTTTTTTTTTATTAPACADAPAPAAEVRATTASADLDGDGRADTVTVAGAGSDDQPGPWQIVATLASGHRRAAPIVDADAVDLRQAVRVLGVAPVGGTPTAFVVVGSGASTSVVGLFQLVGCDLARVTIGGTRPATLAVGGTVTHLDGIRCEAGGGLTVLTATSVDGVTYSATQAAATITDGVLQLDRQPPQDLPADQLDAYGQLVCPGVQPP